MMPLLFRYLRHYLFMIYADVSLLLLYYAELAAAAYDGASDIFAMPCHAD